MPTFAENLNTFADVGHLAGLSLFDAEGKPQGHLQNQPGQAGSLALYHHLYHQYGAITPEAAATGLALFAEHTAHAKEHPNAHPNIDRLFQLIESGQTLEVRLTLA